MKQVSRSAPPSVLNNDVPQVRQDKHRLYTTENPWKGFSERGRQPVCEELHKMFDGECAFCGKRLSSEDSDTQVDHFLPKKRFKFLSLAWENMILLCGDCNLRKSNFSPKSLEGKTFIEDFMKGSEKVPSDAEVFDKNQVFHDCNDRLIDPSFDNSSEHIRFDPASRQFECLTLLGRSMISNFFNRVRRFDEDLKKLSDEIKEVVESELQPEQVVDRHIKIAGHSFFRREFYRYWSEVKKREGVV